MKHTVQLTVNPWGSRTIHFHSTLAGRMAGSRRGTFTPNATDIYTAGASLDALTLAEEFGHGEDAKRKGILYLPWMAWEYVKAWSYWDAAPEVRNRAFAQAHYPSFPMEVRCPDDNA